MASPLQKYYALKLKNLFNNLYEVELTSSHTALHDLRIELKKFRTIIHFLKTVYHKHRIKKAIKLIESIFDEAGTLREMQLLQQWLQQSKMPELETILGLEGSIIYAQHIFLQHIRKHKHTLQKVIDVCGPLVEETNALLPEQYMQKLKVELLEQLRKNLAIEEWHDSRKKIKRWMNAIRWVNSESDEMEEVNFAYFNHLQEAIGNWHDLIIIEDYFAAIQAQKNIDKDLQQHLSAAQLVLYSNLQQREKQVRHLLQQQMPVSTGK
jgi:CHAD domain-containing protein